MKLDLAGLEIEGVSTGGTETCVEVPAWRIAFDLGRCSPRTVSCPRVFFTHAHVDHTGAVALHVAQRDLKGMAPPTYVVPPECQADFEALLEAWRRLERSRLPCDVVALAPGEELRLRRDLVVEAFRSQHRTPSNGYVVWEERKKLRERYAGLAGEEIARLRADGVEVTRTLRSPELVFTGDTQIEVLEEVPVVRRARRLVLECTFLDERVDVASAREKGHLHLDELVEKAELLGEVEAVLLCHFSSRYGREEVVNLLRERLPPGLWERVRVLV